MMSEDIPKSLDIPSVKPITQAMHTTTDATVRGAVAFLRRICLPAAEEFGVLLQVSARAFRARNVAEIATKAEQILGNTSTTDHPHAPPRVVGTILDHGSWIDADDIQRMWAGLLASSCSEDGADDSNLMFVHLLARLSGSQARLLDHACHRAKVELTANGLIFVKDEVSMSVDALRRVCGVDDLHRLDRELDHLQRLELVAGGFIFDSTSTTAEATPTLLALQMFARLRGYRGDPIDFFGLRQAHAAMRAGSSEP